MTQTYWMINGQGTGNAGWDAVVRSLGSTPGVVESVGGPGLKAYRTTAGLFVPPGMALSAKGAVYVNDADVQVAVPLNSGTTTRNDLLVLRHDFAVAPEPRLAYITGGSSYPVPTVRVDVSLSKCPVPSGSAVPSSAIDARAFAGLDTIPCRVVGDIPTSNLRVGQPAFEFDTGRDLRWASDLRWLDRDLPRPVTQIPAHPEWSTAAALGFPAATYQHHQDGHVQLAGLLRYEMGRSTVSATRRLPITGVLLTAIRPSSSRFWGPWGCWTSDATPRRVDYNPTTARLEMVGHGASYDIDTGYWVSLAGLSWTVS